jgi:hypothetical protein
MIVYWQVSAVEVEKMHIPVTTAPRGYNGGSRVISADGTASKHQEAKRTAVSVY